MSKHSDQEAFFASGKDMAASSAHQLLRLNKMLEAALGRFETGLGDLPNGTIDDKEIRRIHEQISEALSRCLKWREKIYGLQQGFAEDECEKCERIGPLDLEAARAEIGRRLDRLRRAKSRTDITGGSDG